MASQDETKPEGEEKQQDNMSEGGAEQQPQKDLGRHDESYKTEMPVFKPSGGGFLRLLTIIIILLLLTLGGLFGWLWWQERSNKKDAQQSQDTTEEPAESEEPACANGLTEYENTDLGFKFCHPESWGAVAVEDAKLDDTDTGSRWNLSFSEKEEVNLGVASANWSTDFGRDGVCSDPASPTLPSFTPFSTEWETFDDGSGVSSVDRGIAMVEDEYLIKENASTTLAEVVCITGYSVLDGTPYTHTSASYSTTFNDEVATPSDHMDSPNVLVPEIDREQFYNFVKSVDNA